MNTFDLFSLKGKNVLITGGRAMYGQGATLALADAGANIYVASHSVESAKDFCENLSKEKGVKVQAVAFDQGDIESIEKMVQFVVEDAGSLDVFVHCSRIIPKGEGGVGWTEDECALEANVKLIKRYKKEQFRAQAAQMAGDKIPDDTMEELRRMGRRDLIEKLASEENKYFKKNIKHIWNN